MSSIIKKENLYKEISHIEVPVDNDEIKKFQIETLRLEVSVDVNAIKKLEEILCEVPNIKRRFQKLSELYVFLVWMARNRSYHVNKEDLAEMFYSKHEERVTKAVETLEQFGLLKTKLCLNLGKSRYYYSYLAQPFNFKASKPLKTVEFVYEIPMRTAFSILGKDSGMHPINDNNNSITIPTTYSTTCLDQTYQSNFTHEFLGWYDELNFPDGIPPKGQFSPLDGRFYHHLHLMAKDQRAFVTWDGEPIVEAWDAHSAFFIVLGFYLKKIKQYDSEDEKRIMTDEADGLMEMAMDNELYARIQIFHNKRAKTAISRDTIKEWVQAYRNQQYKNLFNKNGERTKHPRAKKYRYIDEFFMKFFPNIRLFLLNYPRRMGLTTVKVDTGKHHFTLNKLKPISNVQRDVMPYEFQLISLGLCSDLYSKYGIKAVTVHDAIYMKKSDAEKEIDIDELLSRRLGVGGKGYSYALF